MTLEERASKAEWVAYIHVVSDEMPVMVGTAISHTDFKVVANVTCWLKKGAGSEDDGGDAPQTGDAPATGDANNPAGDDIGNMTVPDAGQNITILFEKRQCNSHTLDKGEKYVLFMEKNMSMFNIFKVTDEPSALADPQPKDFEALHRGIDSGMTGKPEGECIDGVDIPCFEGDYNKEVCDGAASVVATTTTIVAAILAIAVAL